MIEKYDVIIALKDLNTKVYKGCRGTVLMIYPNFPFSYEIEFVNDALETLDILTVKSDEITKVEI